MKTLSRFSLILLFGVLLFSCSNDMTNDTPTKKNNNDISYEEAKVIAQKFIEAQGLFPKTRSSLPLNLVYTDLDTKDPKTRSSNDVESYYIINIGNKGYVIVSGSNATFPVLGYSTESSFNNKNIPTNMSDVLSDFKDEVQYARQNISVTKEHIATRNSYFEDSPNTRATPVVGPLLGAIKWNQSPYYNKYCPSRCPVGCVATATCQIMRYWEYPDRGVGSSSYSSRYGRLTANHDYTLDWDRMPKARLTGPNEQAAKLSYAVAVALKMQFSPSGSGAWQYDVPDVLIDHYKYPRTIRNVYKNKVSSQEWASILKKEFDARRPVQYAGHGNGGGHSFVCDGYASNGYFHYNWGWGGQSDGYFMHTALNPGSLGVGGGSGGFNSGQQMVVGIQAPSGGGGGGDDDDDDNNGGGVDPNPNPNPNPDDGSRKDYGYYQRTKALYSRTTFIKNVSLEGINNTTRSGEGGYNYFKGKTATLSPGYVYEIKLTPGFIASTYREYWKACIDYNGDHRYTTDEIVAQGITNGNESFTNRFKVPNIYSKSGIRLRVSMKWGGYAYTYETFKHGEVEDYDIVIR